LLHFLYTLDCIYENIKFPFASLLITIGLLNDLNFFNIFEAFCNRITSYASDITTISLSGNDFKYSFIKFIFMVKPDHFLPKPNVTKSILLFFALLTNAL